MTAARTAAHASDAPDVRGGASGHHPANSNARGARMRRKAAKTVSLVERVDDGMLLRWLFRLVLVGTVGVLTFDFLAIRENAPNIPSAPNANDEVTVLPPALSDGAPPAPPFEITSEPEAMRQPVSFELGGDGVMHVNGAFDPGSARRFAAEIDARGEYIETISLNSPGGSVDDALRISALIRERGYATSVASGALCASSCPIVMAGGVDRSAGPEAVIGVHQVYGAGGEVGTAAAMSQVQSTTARIARHLQTMGIAPELWFHALETAPDRLRYLTHREMEEIGLVGR